MKQARLSFGTKRKDASEKVSNNSVLSEVEVIEIPDEDPEKVPSPPPKRVRRSSDIQNDSVPESSNGQDCVNHQKAPPEALPDQETPTKNSGTTAGSGEEMETSICDQQETPTEEATEERSGSPVGGSGSSPAGSSSEQKQATTPSGRSGKRNSFSQSADSSPTSGASPRRTPGRPPKRSKTEQAFLDLKRRKDAELRQKEKEERQKAKEAENKKREEERVLREQEKKEAKERKERERIEKEKRREAERLEKEKEREEKERQRKERERKKEEERLEKEKEREEKERQRKEKEEEKRKKDEEKRRELEEEEAKKQKAKQAFKSFFVVKPTSGSPGRELNGEGQLPEVKTTEGSDLAAVVGTTSGVPPVPIGTQCPAAAATRFKPFQLKKDMQLACAVPPAAKARFDRDNFEKFVRICGLNLEEAADEVQDASVDPDGKISLYLDILRSKAYRPLVAKKSRERQRDEEQSDCFIIPQRPLDEREAPVGGRMRAKLLQFVENYRPAYYGTWRKTCPKVTGRRPFEKYEEFDYSVDSDDEWEDVEGEVESLVGTDDEKEKEENGDDDYEEDEFFVPHGYLSESEEEESDDQPLNPEALKARIAARQEEFTADRKAGLPASKMVAVCSVDRDGRNLEAECKVLQQFKAVLLVASQDRPLKPSWEREPDIVINSAKTSKERSEPRMLSDEALRIFCETAHGFEGRVRELYEEFYKRWRAKSDVKISLANLKLTLTANCKKSKHNRLVVNRDMVERFNLKELPEPSDDEEKPATFWSRLLPEEAIKTLIQVAHGRSSTKQVITEFLNQTPGGKYGKAQVKRTLRSIATFVRICWRVRPEVLKAHNLEELDEKFKTEEKPAEDRKETDAAQEKPGKNAPSHDSNGNVVCGELKGKENLEKTPTPKSLSIKKFFSTSTKTNEASPSSNVPVAAAVTEATPIAKKRIQPTMLSKVASIKRLSEPRPVLEPEDVITIADDE